MNIAVFLGAPGSGKGTQAKRLADQHGFRHFSTGDMLRAAIAKGSDTGLKAKSFIERGELVPDNIMIELIESSLAPLPADSRIVLDGFPRTVPQAEALDAKKETSVRLAIFFVIPEAVLINRLTGRRMCEKCGESFHLLHLPPREDGICDKCGANLVQRTDDGESVVKRRLEIFHQQNSGLLEYYSNSAKLRRLDANRAVEFVQRELLTLLS